MMLAAGLCAVGAAIWHQTTILPWELGIGGPVLIVTALLMLLLRGGGRYLAVLLAAAAGAWGFWQLRTYLPILPDFLPQSWPVICLLPIACLLAMLAALRGVRSLWSAGWVQVPGQPPHPRRAPGGVVLAVLVVGLVTAVGFLPHDLRSQLLRPLRPSPPSTLPGAVASHNGADRPTAGGYDHNPLLPPLNSVAPSSPVSPPPPASSASNPAYPYPAPAVPAGRTAGPPRSYPNLNRDLARVTPLREVAKSQTAGRLEFSIGREFTIEQRQMQADGTERLRVRAATLATDSLGRKAPGTARFDVLVDGQGRILRTLPADFVDEETKLLLGNP